MVTVSFLINIPIAIVLAVITALIPEAIFFEETYGNTMPIFILAALLVAIPVAGTVYANKGKRFRNKETAK